VPHGIHLLLCAEGAGADATIALSKGGSCMRWQSA
jgi:hypothetical protein